MNFEKKICVSLSEIEKELMNGSRRIAMLYLKRLHTNVGKVARNKEALNVESLHSAVALLDARNENRTIMESIFLPHEIEIV